MRSASVRPVVLALALSGLAAGCGGDRTPPAESAATAAADTYPAPRWPSYFKPPTSVEDLMPAARSLVRNRSGLQGNGLGVLEPGESVLLVADLDGDPMVLEAIKRALEERKVTPHIKFGYEFQGVTRSGRRRSKTIRPRSRCREPASIRPSPGSTGSSPTPSRRRSG